MKSITIGAASDLCDSNNLDGHLGTILPWLILLEDHMPPVFSDGAIGNTHIVTLAVAIGVLDPDMPLDVHDEVAKIAVDCTEY